MKLVGQQAAHGGGDDKAMTRVLQFVVTVVSDTSSRLKLRLWPFPASLCSLLSFVGVSLAIASVNKSNSTGILLSLFHCVSSRVTAGGGMPRAPYNAAWIRAVRVGSKL